MTTLKRKLETAFTSVLKQSEDLPEAFIIRIPDVEGIQGYRVYEGYSSEWKQVPYVSCEARNGSEEEPLGSGNRFFDVVIGVIGEVDTPESEGLDADGQPVDFQESVQMFSDQAQAIFGILKVDELPALLSAASLELFVFDPITDMGEDPEIIRNQFSHSLVLRVYCCGNDLG